MTSLLPFLGKSLAKTVKDVTAQLCLNLERIAPFYGDDSVDAGEDEEEFKTDSESGNAFGKYRRLRSERSFGGEAT